MSSSTSCIEISDELLALPKPRAAQLSSNVTFRRAAAVTAAFLMFQLVVAGRGPVCPQHDREHASSAVASDVTETSEGHQHAQHHSEEPSSPDQHYPMPDCCPAMNTCSSSVALRSAGNLLSAGILPLSIPVYVATLFHSRVESPDPPPPKA